MVFYRVVVMLNPQWVSLNGDKLDFCNRILCENNKNLGTNRIILSVLGLH